MTMSERITMTQMTETLFPVWKVLCSFLNMKSFMLNRN